jgi:CelD/BcsL family acetyltransferase involved in cellulose biosynthesis
VLRRTYENHSIDFIRHRPAPARDGDGDPRWDLYAMCEHVALASWQAKSASGNTLTHERVRQFLRDAHAVAAHNGMVDVNLLLVDERPAAFVYNYQCHGHLTTLRIGYDPSIGVSGLGTALLLRSLEDSCERGDLSCDLGSGNARFQRHLRTRVETTYRLSYWPLSSWRLQAARIARWAGRRWSGPVPEIGRAASA